jgi:hypothetical protein
VDNTGARAVAKITNVVFTVIVLFLSSAAAFSHLLVRGALHRATVTGVRLVLVGGGCCACTFGSLCGDTAGARPQTLQFVNGFRDKWVLESHFWGQAMVCLPLHTFLNTQITVKTTQFNLRR